jgi:hypothetical protein
MDWKRLLRLAIYYAELQRCYEKMKKKQQTKTNENKEQAQSQTSTEVIIASDLVNRKKPT